MIEQIAAAESSATKKKMGTRKSDRSAGVAVVKTIAKQTRQQAENKYICNHSAVKASSIDDLILSLEREAEECLQKAALEYDHSDAFIILANDALLEKNDITTALDYYDRASKKGSGNAYFNLGHLYWTGYANEDGNKENDFDPDKIKSITYFKNAIDCGDIDAMYFIGASLIGDYDDFSEETRNAFNTVFHSEVSGSSLSCKQKFGLKLIETAGKSGHGEALYYLSLLHRNGHSDLDIEPFTKNGKDNKFHAYLESAVLAGSSNAIFIRGNCYYSGEDGYEKNIKLALNDFLKASDLDHADAALCAGVIFFQGDNEIPRDRRRAFELYQKAGELGSVEGWRNVVACYLTGDGVPKNEQTARHIYDTMIKNYDVIEGQRSE